MTGAPPPRLLRLAWVLLLAVSLPLLSAGGFDSQGMCSGSTLLTSNFGIFSEHIGHGDYNGGIVCEWRIEPADPEGFIHLQVHPNSIFGGRLYVWADTDTARDPDYFYWAHDPQYYLDYPPDTFDNIYSYFTTLPYDFITYDDGIYNEISTSHVLTLESDAVVLRYYAYVPTPFEPYPAGFEHSFGFTFSYWTPSYQGDMTCYERQNITVAGQGYITDGYGVYSGEDYTWDPPNCSWELTSSEDFFLTIKSFQPIFSPASKLKITVGTTVTEIDANTVSSLEVPIVDGYVFWSNFYIPVPAGEVTLIEYEGPTYSFPTSDSSYFWGDSGFMIEYWLDDLAISNTTLLTLKEQECLTVDAYTGVGTMQQVNKKFNLQKSLKWTINVVNSTVDVLIWVKEFNLGTEATDVLSIFSYGSDGVTQTNTLDMSSPYQPLIILSSVKRITIQYRGNSMNHRGFRLMIGYMSDFHKCIGAVTLPEGEIIVPLSPPNGKDKIYYSKDSDPFAVFIQGDSDLKTVQLWGGNRCLVFSHRGYNWNYFSDMPDADLNYILIWVRTFSLDLEPINLSVEISFANTLQKNQKFMNERIVLSSVTTFSAYVIQNNLVLRYERGTFSDLNLDGIGSNGIRTMARMENEDLLYINTLSQDTSDIRVFYLEDGAFVEADYSPVSAVIGDFFGHAMSVSPAGYWVASYHSPDFFKIFLYCYNRWAYDSQYKYTDWSYPNFFQQLVTATKLTDDLFVASVCTFDQQVGVVVAVLCEWENTTHCHYNPLNYRDSDYLMTTDWHFLDVILISQPGMCDEQSQNSIDIIRTAGSDILIMVGSPDSKSVTVLFLDGGYPVSLKRDINSTYSTKIPINRTGLDLHDLNLHLVDGSRIVTISNSEDSLFGSDVAFSGDTSEIVIMGSRFYTLLLDDIFSNASNYNISVPAIPYKNFYSLTFLPNRFFLADQDWSSNASPQIGYAPQNLFALKTTGNTLQITDIPVTSIGREMHTNGETVCPRGSYKSFVGFGSCVFCPIGSYQNETGATFCMECKNDSYCPIGSTIDLPGVGTQQNVSLPKFSTYASATMDTSLWDSVFASTAWLAAPLYIIWGTSILLFFYVMVARRKTGGSHLPGFGGFIEDFFNCMDPDPKTIFNPKTNKNEEIFSLKAALLNIILYTFLILATIYILWYFAQYRQFDGQPVILNNARTSSLKPFFTASDDEASMLKYIRSRGIHLSLSINGYSNAICEEICKHPSNFVSTGCYLADATICSDFGDTATFPTCIPNGDNCNITWVLPTGIELLLQSSFTFYIADSYTQGLDVTIRIPGEPQPNILDPSAEDTVTIDESYTKDSIQLPDPRRVIFGILRNYELTYVLQSSEQVFNPAANDWRIQAIFLPLQHQSVDSTTKGGYLQTKDPNSVELTFNQQNYYVSNVEGRILSSGQLFLQLVMVITGVIGVFDLFTKGFMALYELISGKIKGEEAEEEQDVDLDGLSAEDKKQMERIMAQLIKRKTKEPEN